MRVIATAGHVDHGKSALVEALTGTHPDRLQEEKEREMTIDLGFAYFPLPGGEPVAIIDVPGHSDFIENMLAGVGGVDAALLAIAADEGVRPQTREHLAILDLLGVRSGLVALTKVDLAPDREWLELVQEEARRLLVPTGWVSCPILPVSARTRQGLQDLVGALAQVLAARPRRPDLGRPRLPVDRAFTLSPASERWSPERCWMEPSRSARRSRCSPKEGVPACAGSSLITRRLSARSPEAESHSTSVGSRWNRCTAAI
jgi:selenocysteine-specific elongation factor